MEKEFHMIYFNKSHNKVINKVDNKQMLHKRKHIFTLTMYWNNLGFIILNILNLGHMYVIQLR
jgi:hypothetical protein